MVAQTFCDIFFMKKRHQISIYKQLSDYMLIVFFINNIKINSFTSLTEVGLFKVILVGTGVQLKLRKPPQCIYCYQMKPDFTCYNLFDNLDAIG